MYHLLVVDDEDISVRGIVEGIDWSDLPISRISTAYDAEEAMQVFQELPVHLLLSDIDMPKTNGIELLAWVKMASPATETIFLTGHADFKYAQQAIHLSSFDYLLKPIDHALLKAALGQAIEKLRQDDRMRQYEQAYAVYYRQWHNQLPALIERMWQDVLNLRVPTTPLHLSHAFRQYDMELQPDDSIQAVMISIEQWQEKLSERDEEIMTYAVKNVAAELIVAAHPGSVIQDDANGVLLAILYRPDAGSMNKLKAVCHEFVRKCSDYLHCVLSCYIGDPIPIRGIRHNIQQLMDIERNNITNRSAVVVQGEQDKKIHGKTLQINMNEWGALLELGRREELMSRIKDIYARLAEDDVDYSYMTVMYYNVVQMVFAVLQRKSVPIEAVYPAGEWREGEAAAKSLVRMKVWTAQFCGAALDYLEQHGRDVSHVIRKVMQYIDSRLSEDFGREDIARHVYLNAAYLSRLFRKETGRSLTDYMTDARMEKAKSLLSDTNTKISDVAGSVGYGHFSHFSQLFKKATGMTPQEYRRVQQE